MRYRPTLRDLSVFAGGFACPTDEFPLPWPVYTSETAGRAGHEGDGTGAHPWSSLQDTSPSSRSSASPTSSGPIAAALNTRPKYVASTTLTDPQWADTTVLSGDVAAAVGELKAKPGGELQVHGSGNLVRWLVDNHLVDEITPAHLPVVVGQGTRLFPATGPDIALELVHSRATPTGVTIQVFRPTGRPQYATATT
jgi:dihydrofolate reductase